MPLYDYRCTKCNHVFEEFRRISEREEPISKPCPSCETIGTIEQKIGAPMAIDPTKLDGRMPINTKLQEKFKQIHENTPGSVLDRASTITKI